VRQGALRGGKGCQGCLEDEKKETGRARPSPKRKSRELVARAEKAKERARGGKGERIARARGKERAVEGDRAERDGQRVSGGKKETRWRRYPGRKDATGEEPLEKDPSQEKKSVGHRATTVEGGKSRY